MTELLVRLDEDRRMPLTLIVALTVIVVLVLVGGVGYMIDRSVDDEETERARQEEERSR
jgi:predicted small integral membrane protein